MRAGVPEYWIINPIDQSIEQHFLEKGSYILHNIYGIYPNWEPTRMCEEQKAQIEMHLECHLFDDLDISVEDVFEGLIREWPM